MPIYEYTCDDCPKTTEARRAMADADKPIACEHCHSTHTRRALSTFLTPASSRSDSPPSGPGCGCGNPHGPCGM